MNNVITASRMLSALSCLRKHFWQYEIGLRKPETSLALKIGSAWARAMEARWNGLEFQDALYVALPDDIELDAYAAATVSGLLAAYYDYYGVIENVGQLQPEVQFRSELGIEDFTAEGKIDGIGTLMDSGLEVIIENKTTGDSIAPDSEYWLRLNFNIQLCQYILAAREMGRNIDNVFYDVCRKPSIRPKEVATLDDKKLKIVVDSEGKRVLKKDGAPRETADKEKGFTLDTHLETPAEFSDRLYYDVMSRPDFYFVRREVPVLEQTLDAFIRQREAIIKMIISLRENETASKNMVFTGASMDVRESQRDPEAWPRNVSKDTCNFCPYKLFCLNHTEVAIDNPPFPFTVQPFNPELEKYDTSTDNITS